MENNHPFAELLGLKILTNSDGKSTSLIPFKKTLLNPNNVLHGGVVHSLADTCMGAALASSLELNERCATIEIKVMYLKPAGSYDLTSKSKIIRKGKKVAWLESEVFSKDELIAKASASYAIY